jgi:hypothetical protein
MKWFTAWVLTIAVTGCQTMRPIEAGPPALQERIRSGDLLKPGDRVWIVTSNEKAHRFAVTKVEAGLIVGPNESVPIDQVMYFEKRQFENAKVPISFSFDWEVSIAALIAIAAYAAEQR